MADQKKQQELIELLSTACEELGWVIGICSDNPEEPADGLIIGPEDFVYEVLSRFDQSYEVMTKEMNEEHMKELEPSSPKKRNMYH